MQPKQSNNLTASFNELKRRKVIRSLIGYAVFAWIILQIVDFSFEPLRLPDWMATVVVIAIIIGFPIVAILSWAFDWTSDGIKRAEVSSGLNRWQTSLVLGVMLMPVLALCLFFYNTYNDVIQQQLDAASQEQAPADSLTPPPSSSSRSIAILPLADFDTADASQQMGDALAEEVINLLAQNQTFAVASRTSSFAFRDTTDDIKAIGQKLNVFWVLEGSVRSSGDQMRITVQLIDTSSGFHVWSETFDRQVTNSFATQDEVSALIASTLTGVLQGTDIEQAKRYQLSDFSAFQNYQHANELLTQRTPDSIVTAIKLYQSILGLYPTYAPAYVGLSDAYILESIYGNRSVPDAISQAQESLELALSLDGQLGQAWASLGLMHAQVGLVDSAESAFRKAIKLNPDYPLVYPWFANLLGLQGRISEQQQFLEKGESLAPDDLLLRMTIASNYLFRGETEVGFDILEQALEQSPDSIVLLTTSALWNLEYGRADKATEQIRLAKVIAPDNPQVTMANAFITMLDNNLELAIDTMASAYQSASNNVGIASEYAALLFYARHQSQIHTDFVETHQLLTPVSGSESLSMTVLRVFSASLAWLSADEALAVELLEVSRSVLEKLYATPDAINLLSQAAWLYTQIGDIESSRLLLLNSSDVLSQIEQNQWDTPQLAYSIAVLEAVRGDTNAAMKSLKVAVEKGWSQLWLARHDPRLLPLQTEAAFTELMQ